MLACPDCSATCARTDNYCRQCGMFLAAQRGVVLAQTPAASRAIDVSRPALPAPVKKVATAVVIGSALQIGLGLAGKYLASQGAKQGVAAALAKPANAKKAAAVVQAAPQALTAISETVVIRRVFLRRD